MTEWNRAFILNVPKPIHPILGIGMEIKNRFCLLNGLEASLNEPLGDLSLSENYKQFEEKMNQLEGASLYSDLRVAHDLHPDYLTTQWAKDHFPSDRLIPVQHHQAHVASVCAEHHIEEPVLGVAFDGFGLGMDGTGWGGEFLIVHRSDFQRVGHLLPFPLLGGDRAVREIWRSAYGLLYTTLGMERASEVIPPHLKPYRNDFSKAILDPSLSPRSSSMGRLFDAVACLIRVRDSVEFEGQAAIELEKYASDSLNGTPNNYAFDILQDPERIQLDPTTVLLSILQDQKFGLDTKTISRKFHESIIQGIVRMIDLLSKKYPIKKVVLSGGCFQNRILSEGSTNHLKELGFNVFKNEKIPCNDSNISLGQVWIAAQKGWIS